MILTEGCRFNSKNPLLVQKPSPSSSLLIILDIEVFRNDFCWDNSNGSSLCHPIFQYMHHIWSNINDTPWNTRGGCHRVPIVMNGELNVPRVNMGLLHCIVILCCTWCSITAFIWFYSNKLAIKTLRQPPLEVGPPLTEEGQKLPPLSRILNN